MGDVDKELKEVARENSRNDAGKSSFVEAKDLTDPKFYAKAASLVGAVLSGGRISPERQAKRITICKSCPKLGLHGTTPVCTECGCRLSGDRSLVNLTLYEETEKYGCFYENEQGRVYSRWKEAGV